MHRLAERRAATRLGRVLRLALGALALFTVIPVTSSACDAMIAAVPAVLSSPGRHCLAADLSHAGSAPAIVVSTAGVVVDLNGFTLQGTAGPSSVSTGIASSGTHGGTVRNGRITGFRWGVVLSGAGSLIEDVSLLDLWYIGAWVDGTGSAIRRVKLTGLGGSSFPGDIIPLALVAEGNGSAIEDCEIRDVQAVAEAVALTLGPGVSLAARRNVVVNPEVSPNTWGVWLTGPATAEISGNLFVRYERGLGIPPNTTGVYFDNVFMNVPIPVDPRPGVKVDAGGNSVFRASCEPVYRLPWVISAPGVYCLVRNLSTPQTTGAAVTIEADDVTLDLRGFKIGGGGAGPATQAVGVHAAGRSGVRVRNGNVRGFRLGVALEASGDPDAGGHTVESLLLDDNKEAGILVEGSHSRVRRNRVLIADPAGVPSGAVGILVRGASARVQANEFNDDRPGGGDGAFGFRLELAPGAVVERNSAAWRIAGGGTTGFWLEGNPGALVVRNTVQNAGTGTRCVGSPCKVRGGTTLSTGTAYVNIVDAGGNQ